MGWSEQVRYLYKSCYRTTRLNDVPKALRVNAFAVSR